MAQIKPVYNRGILMAFISNSNIHDDTIYIPQSCVDETSVLNYRYGLCACGKKISGIKGARFYVFGGKDDTGTLFNDLMSFDVTIYAGGPVLTDSTTIIPDGTEIPTERIFAKIKLLSDGILIYGGIDETGETLSDIQKYTFATNTQTEITPTGDVPSPTIFS